MANRAARLRWQPVSPRAMLAMAAGVALAFGMGWLVAPRARLVPTVPAVASDPAPSASAPSATPSPTQSTPGPSPSASEAPGASPRAAGTEHGGSAFAWPVLIALAVLPTAALLLLRRRSGVLVRQQGTDPTGPGKELP